MASRVTLTVLFGFYAIFCCLYLHEEANTAKIGTKQSLATTALAPAVLITLALTPLLTYAHVWALGRANAGGAGAGPGAEARFVARLAEATLLAAAVALLSGAAVRLGAAGEVLCLGGADDVGWLG